MAESLSATEKITLIHENLQEVIKPEIIEDVILKQGRPLKIYWGGDSKLSSSLFAEIQSRNCNNWATTLRILCTDGEAGSFFTCWL